MTTRTMGAPDDVRTLEGEGRIPPRSGRYPAPALRQRSRRPLCAPTRPYRYPDLANLIGKILACIWGAFYFFILFGTSATLKADPSQAPALVWLCLGPLGSLGGVAVILLIRRRPDIGALVVVSGFLLWLVVEQYRPDTWYMVPALLCPGLLAIAVLLNIWARKPPPDVIRADRTEFVYKTHDDENNRGHTR